MPCKGCNLYIAPAQIRLVSAGTTGEYIAAGDSQASVPFTTEIRRDFDLQQKIASSLSYLLLQLGSNDGEASLPEKGRLVWRPHPSRREVTCGDIDMDRPRTGAVLHMEWASEAGPT